MRRVDYSSPEFLPPSRREREAAREVAGSRWLDEQNRRRAARSRAHLRRANGEKR